MTKGRELEEKQGWGKMKAALGGHLVCAYCALVWEVHPLSLNLTRQVIPF